ncbi:MAG: hypothetical protein QXR26_03150 [Candidatus Caldarchaeum sp.]
MGGRFFADIHRLASKKRGRKTEENFHTYSTDGENFSRVRRITDIPAEHADELYVDVIPVELTDGFVELLRRGVRVFYLRRMTVMAEKREELGLSKTSRNDIRTMMAIDPKWFREVDEDYLVMRRLTTAFRSSQRVHASFLNRAKALQDAERMILMKSVKVVEESMMEMASSIVSEAEKRYPYFKKVVEELGITGDNYLIARQALAEIMPYIERTRFYRCLRKFFGLFKVRESIKSIAKRRDTRFQG